MRGEAEFAEERIEETAPLIIIRIGELKHDRNVIGDVHGLKHNSGGNGGGGGCIIIGGRGNGGMGGRVGVRGLKVEEGIVVHGGHGDEHEAARQRRRRGAAAMGRGVVGRKGG